MLDRLAVHTICCSTCSLEQCVAAWSHAEIPGIAIWRQLVEPIGADVAGRMVRDAGLRVPSLVRGGFFVDTDQRRRVEAIDETRRALDDAAAIGAEMVVIVPGAHPEVPLDTARGMVTDALSQLTEHAATVDVQLGLEPLHPMYAADRSCLCTLADAHRVCNDIAHPSIGVIVDVYHVWWDPEVMRLIASIGDAGLLTGFHVSDWRSPTRDLLMDRAMMGDGCIPIRHLREAADDAGFGGMIEVELLSHDLAARDPNDVLADIRRAFVDHV